MSFRNWKWEICLDILARWNNIWFAIAKQKLTCPLEFRIQTNRFIFRTFFYSNLLLIDLLLLYSFSACMLQSERKSGPWKAVVCDFLIIHFVYVCVCVIFIMKAWIYVFSVSFSNYNENVRCYFECSFKY